MKYLDNTKERLDYLDYAKGFAILLVVLGHIYSNNEVRTWLYSFHMPIFFIISGCLCRYSNNKRNFKEFTYSKIRTLLLPYIVFSIIYITFKFILSGSTNALMWDYIYVFTMYGVGPCWFLPALFMAETIFYLLSKVIKKDISLLVASIFIFSIGLFISNTDYNLIMFVIDRSLFALFFYMVGYCSFEIISKINLNYLLIAILVIGNAILSHINGNIDLWSLKFNNIILYVLCSIIGSFSILFLLKKFNSNKLMYIGKNSLIIMATHDIIIMILKKFIDINFNDYFIGFLIFILVMCIQIPIIKLINKYTPWMIGRFKKKEKYIEEVPIN